MQAPGKTDAAPGAAKDAMDSAPAAPPGGGDGSMDERRRRWAEINARIDRGEFGEEIRKLPEEERRQRMRELRRQREGLGGGPGQ